MFSDLNQDIADIGKIMDDLTASESCNIVEYVPSKHAYALDRAVGQPYMSQLDLDISDLRSLSPEGHIISRPPDGATVHNLGYDMVHDMFIMHDGKIGVSAFDQHLNAFIKCKL